MLQRFIQGAEIIREDGFCSFFRRFKNFLSREINNYVNKFSDILWSFRGIATFTVGSYSANFVAENQESIEATTWRINSEREQISSILNELRRDDVFFDIGANTGVYSCFAAQACDEVISFEPYPPNISELEQNVLLNKGEITIIDKALSDESGVISFSAPNENKPGYGHGTFSTDSNSSIEVKTACGDDLVQSGEIPQPNVVKIDVEGAEPLVLGGLRETLQDERCRILYCEVHLPADHRSSVEDFGSTVTDIWKSIENLGFSVENVWGRGSPDFHIKAVKNKDRIPDSGYTFFGSPRAVYSNGKTFVGSITTTGDIQVSSINHNNNDEIETTILESDFNSDIFETDDHAAPQICVRDDGHVIAFWDRKIGEIRYKISDELGSVSSFGPKQTISSGGADYSSPVKLADGTLMLFYRGPEVSQHSYYTSEDGGETWDDKGPFITTSGDRAVYTNTYKDGSNIHFVVSNHPRNDGSTRDFDSPHNIWYVRYNIANESWYKADDTQIATTAELPIDLVSDLDVVYDSEVTGDEAWLWDIAVENDTPRILFATFPSFENHRYQHARWTGSEWEINEIAKAGGSLIKEGERTEDEYSGGIVFDHDDPNIVYMSTEESLDDFRIHCVSTSDNGRTWERQDEIATGFRPEYVYGNTGDIRAVYMNGEYKFFEEFDTDIKWF